MGFQGKMLPYALMLFLTSAMSHADTAKVHLGFERAVYHWPGFTGDTFKKRLRIYSIRPTSDHNHSVFTFFCELINQRNVTCFTCLKSMMFPFSVAASDFKGNISDAIFQQPLKEHLISRADTLVSLGNQSLRRLRAGHLIIHRMARPLTHTQTMQLASIARLTHQRHFDRQRYAQHEIYVPGGCIIGLATSASSRDFHEKLHEQIDVCTFINTLFPGETLSAISYISNVDEHLNGSLEMLSIRTLGIKNMDVVGELSGKPLPLDLFTTKDLQPKHIEAICDQKYPELSKKIVVQMDRKILRQAPQHDTFLL